MKMRLEIVVLVAIVAVFAGSVRAQQGNVVASNISSALSGLATNDLRFDTVASRLSDTAVSASPVDGLEEVSQLSSEIASLMRRYSTTLEDISRLIETKFGDPRALSGDRLFVDADSAAGVLNMTFDSRFGTQISTEDSVVKVAPGTNLTAFNTQLSLFASEDLTGNFASNLENLPGLKHQYFAAEAGFVRYFPAVQWPGAGPFDGRETDWYSNAVAGPKTVVLLIEQGLSSSTLSAVTKFLHTFSAKDWLQVITYNDESVILPTEFTERTQPELVRVNERNRIVLEQFIVDTVYASSPSVGSSAAVKLAFQAAIDALALNDFNDAKPSCQPTVVWVTGARRFTNSIRLAVNGANKLAFGNQRAVVNVYSMQGMIGGGDFTYDDFQRRVACDNDGTYYAMTSAAELERELPRWYGPAAIDRRAAQISAASGTFGGIETPVMTFTTLGFQTHIFGAAHPELGLIMSLVRPLYSGTELIGVFGIEFSLQEIQHLFDRSLVSNVFGLLSNEQGDTLIHNHYADPSSINNVDFWDTRLVEVTPAFFNVRTGMVLGESGTRSPIAAIRPNDEQKTQVVLSEFSYTDVKNTPLSVCLVHPQSILNLVDIESTSSSGSEAYNTFLNQYDAQDLIDAGITIVSDADHGSASITYSVPLYSQAASAYQNPTGFLGSSESSSSVASRHAYVNDFIGAQNPGFARSNKDHIQAVLSSGVGTEWINTQQPHMIYRRVTFFDGLSISYPGRVDVPKDQDFRDEDWFNRATEFTGVSVSPPSVGAEVSFASVVLSVPVVHPAAQEPVAVMSYELRYDSFYPIAIAGTACDGGGASCILVDQRGVIIGSPTLTNGDASSINWFYREHPRLFQALFDNGLVFRQEYTDYVTRELHEFYMFDVERIASVDPFSGSLSAGCESGNYQVSVVPSSNLVLVLLESGYSLPISCPPFIVEPPQALAVDPATEVVFDFRSPAASEHCIVVTDSDAETLDRLARPDYASCFELEKFREIDWIRWDDGVAIAFVTLASVLMFLCVILAVLIVINFSEPIIRLTSPLFLLISLFGALMLFSTIFFLTGEPTGNICRSRAWFAGVGFVLMFAALFAKTFRVFMLVRQAKKFRSASLSNVQLIQYMAVPIAVELLLLLLWSAIDSPEPDTIDDQTDDDKLFLQCRSDDHWTWQGILIGFNAAFVVIGIYLAFATRRVPTLFNESKAIGIAIYNVGFCALIGIILAALLEEFPFAWYSILSAAILLGTIGTVALLIPQKLFIVYFKPDQNNSQYIASNFSSRGGSSGVSGISTSSDS